MRLPEFPTKFYDKEILQKIGNTIGQLLRLDICTQNARRGQYARLCLPVPIDQPLITEIYIGDFHQRITYEGIPFLCYNCGRIGHNAISCHKLTLLPNS